MVAFASEAENLAANDTNGFRDVFVRNRVLGTNILVSVSTNGGSGNCGSTEASISTDGRYVAFTSAADDLTAGHTNRLQDVFIRDLQTETTRLISVTSNGANGNGPSYSPTVGTSGRFVLFRSKATNLVASAYGPNNPENLFLNDAQTGTTFALTTSGVFYSAMTPDGHFVAYATSTRLAIWDSLAASDVYSLSAGITGLGFSPHANRLVYWIGSVPARSMPSIERPLPIRLSQRPIWSGNR